MFAFQSEGISSDCSASYMNVHVSSGSSDQTDASSFDLDMKNFCEGSHSNNTEGGRTPSCDSNNLDLYAPHHANQFPSTHHKLEDDSDMREDHDSNRVTPIYWSASQLLFKLEFPMAS